jgi:hypothetical protein
MDKSIYELLSTILIDFLIFLLTVLGFAAYRKIRSQPIVLPLDVDVIRPHLHEAEYSSVHLAQKVKNMSLEEVYEALGEWGFLYLAFHKLVLCALCILSVLGCGVLLVIYITSSSDAKDDFHRTGIAHITNNENEDMLAAPVVFLIVFSLIIYAFAVWLFMKIKHSRNNELVHPSQHYVVLVSNIPKTVPSQLISAKIADSLVQVHGQAIRSIYCVPYFVHAYQYFLKLENAEKKLKYLVYDLEVRKSRPMIWKNWQKVDGINFFTRKADSYKRKVLRLQKEYKDQNSGIAFIICENKALASSIISTGLQHPDIKAWTCETAPSPGDLIWKNIGLDPSTSFLRKVITNFAFLIIFLIFLTPASFIKQIEDLFKRMGIQLIGGVVAMYLPSLLLLLYQALILPFVVDYMVKREKHDKKHKEISSGLKKYLFYLIFYWFLYPVLGLQFIEFVRMFLNEDSNWQQLFSLRITESGQFFTVFLIHQAFLKNGWDLIVAYKFFWAQAKSILASTSTERTLAYEADPFMFDYEFAISINTLIIACGFSIVYPVILLPATLFFVLRVIET